MPIRIQDVARQADVSISTVSRVIHKAANVQPEMVHRVHQAMDELGYVPNSVAQSLRRRNTKTIGMIVSDLRVNFFPNLIRRLEQELFKRDYMVVSVSSYDDPETEKRMIRMLKSRQVDAMIVSSTGRNEPLLKAIEASGTPVIIYDRRSRTTEFPSVYVDKYRAMALALDHLCALGHERIALVTGDRELSSNYDRYMGMQAYVYDRGLSPECFSARFGSFTAEFGMEAARELLCAHQPPTAMIAGSIAVGAGILWHCKENGISIPNDLSLISFGDFSAPSVVEPKLTYIDDMHTVIAGEILQLLEPLLNGGESVPARSVSLAPILIEGGSCGQRIHEGEMPYGA